MGLTQITSDGITDATIATADLADQSVTLAKLPHGTSSNDGKFLRANNGADPTFETVSSVGGATGADFNDNVKARFGTGNDLTLEHNGTLSKILNESSRLIISGSASDNLDIMHTQSEYMASFIPNGAVELYHDNTKRFETTSSGAAVFNTSSPQTSASSQANDLVVSGSGDMGLTLHSDSSSGDSNIFFSDPDSSSIGSIRYLHNNNQIRFYVNGNTSSPAMQWNSNLTIYFNGNMYSNGNSYSTGSDLNMKSNLVQFTNTLDDLKKLTGYKFDIKCGDGTVTRKSAGVIAQDVEKVYPDFVEVNPETGMKSLEYTTLIGVLVEAVKELTTRVETLEAA
tara:strand:- start:277 stop:1296 length:1020 start_codon:yes stop_codon:yes gene_type:complete